MAVEAQPAIASTTRVVLRDGSTAGVRLSTPADFDAMREFFEHLSPDNRRLRFLASAHASDELIRQLCDNTDPRKACTLIVCRRNGTRLQIVGVGSYLSTSDENAEIAFAVDDQFHRKGIATALLQRLAHIGTDVGFESFSATTLAENVDMLEVFRESGFEVGSSTADGCVDVQLSVEPSSIGVALSEQRERLSTAASLQAILRPRAVAVLGVSRDDTNLGRRIYDSLVRTGFTGTIFAVNPAASEIGGQRCYQNARDLPPGIDLAVVAVPREALLDAIDDCAAIGVKGVVVISAGLAECDDRGRQLQAELVERVRGYGMRMVGPNCMGVINSDPAFSLNASFAERMPLPGKIALASQSGGLGLAVLQLAASRHIGLSMFVSLGNKADVSGNDLLQYIEQDPSTSVALLYLESFGNPRKFGQLARRISRSKPIVVVKSGRTPAGLRAAASHTAGLASSELAVEGLFQQAGVIRAESIEEMFDLAVCLEAQPLPRGRRVAIVTNAGGPGILATDAAAAAGLDVVPVVAGLKNPIDLIASAPPDAYRENLERLLLDRAVDAVIAIYTTVDSRRTAGALSAISEGVAAARRAGAIDKPVLVCTMALTEAQPLKAGTETIPVYAFPEQAARTLGKVAAYAEWRQTPPGNAKSFDTLKIRNARNMCRDIVSARGETWLTTEELRRLLDIADLHTAPGVLAHSADEAANLARVFGFPVVAKVVSAKAIHKTEIGGVKLHLATDAAVREAYAELTARGTREIGAIDGILIQPMITGSVETLVGLTQHPTFGPLVAFALGGIYVELFRDLAFRIAPLTDRDADDLIRSVKGFRILEGYRSQTGVDIPALRELLLKVSWLGDHIPELLELEFNPVMALRAGRGYAIADARARVGKGLRAKD